MSIAICVCALVGLFAFKPLHIDDPLFVWAGEAISRDPFHPYLDFVNWSGTARPMYEVMHNPPAVPYCIALVTKLFGSDELTLHLAFLLPAFLFVVGTYRLADRWCRHPALATLAAALAPGFLVSATNVMADVWTAALIVWSVHFWIDGVDRSSSKRMLVAGLLAGTCILSKYVGLVTLPLLAFYAIGKRRRLGAWVPALLVPILMWGGYELAFRAYLGIWPLTVVAHALGQEGDASAIGVALVVLAGLGGAALAPVLLLGLSARRNALLAVAGAAFVVVLIGIGVRWSAGQHSGVVPARTLIIGSELTLFAAAGLGALILAARHLRKARTLENGVLALWVLEILVFVSVVNWFVSARAFLPAMPALAIIACRAFEAEFPDMSVARQRVASMILVLSGAISVLLNFADYEQASSSKRAGEQVVREQLSTARGVWFQGHWGFQYYAERSGAKPMERNGALVKPGDRVIVPTLNSNVFGIAEADYVVVKVERHELWAPMTTFSRAGSAGFYASTLGILPYGAGFREPATFVVFERK